MSANACLLHPEEAAFNAAVRRFEADASTQYCHLVLDVLGADAGRYVYGDGGRFYDWTPAGSRAGGLDLLCTNSPLSDAALHRAIVEGRVTLYRMYRQVWDGKRPAKERLYPAPSPLPCVVPGCEAPMAGDCPGCGSPHCRAHLDRPCATCAMLAEPLRCEACGCETAEHDLDFCGSERCERLLCPHCRHACPCGEPDDYTGLPLFRSAEEAVTWLWDDVFQMPRPDDLPSVAAARPPAEGADEQ